MAPMRVENAREVPEYEIDPKELDFSNRVDITKVTFYFAFNIDEFGLKLKLIVCGEGNDNLTI